MELMEDGIDVVTGSRVSEQVSGRVLDVLEINENFDGEP